MQTITLKSDFPETVVALLKTAMNREKRILSGTIRTTRERIDSLSKTLGVNLDRLMAGEVEHPDADDMRLLELEGEVEMLRHLEAELKAIESVEICA